MTRSPLWQTWFFSCAVLVAIMVNLFFRPDMNVQLLMLVPAVAILGLPHGALDLPIAQSFWSLKGWRGHALFAGLYTGLASLLICVWIAFPGPTLWAFLVYSAFHFSGDWDDSAVALRWTGGAATVGATALFKREEVATIFSYLAPETAANLAALLLAVCGAMALIFYIAIIASEPKLRTKAAIEQGFIWIAAACLSPLVYFVVYFCTLHSVRHFTGALEGLDNTRSALRVAILLSVVTALVGLIGFMTLQRSGTEIMEQSILQIVFIGLAALTVPHMILVDRFQHQTRARDDSP
jgi:Brp/Blh family beta-carotene 15,15'-monooxygenase